jgi:hypothetical protein
VTGYCWRSVQLTRVLLARFRRPLSKQILRQFRRLHPVGGIKKVRQKRRFDSGHIQKY